MTNTTVTITGFEKFLNTQLKIIKDLADKQIEDIAIKTAVQMQFHIQASIARPESSGNLVSSIYAKKINSGHWGVGEINFLNQQAPYWHWINYGVAQSGRSIPPGFSENPLIQGSFSPNRAAPSQGSFRQGRFQIGQGHYPLFPKKPITPHNYILHTVQDVNTIIRGVLRKGFK